MPIFECEVPCYFKLTFWEKGRRITCDEGDCNNIPWPFVRVDGPDTRPDSIRLKPSAKADRRKIEKEIERLQEVLDDSPVTLPKQDQMKAQTEGPTRRELMVELDALNIPYKPNQNKAELTALLAAAKT